MAERNTARPVYGITVAAELLEVPVAALRLFESRGLLEPFRSGGGTRRYSEDDLDRLRRVIELRDEGVNLTGIEKVLRLQDDNQALRDELHSSEGAADAGARE